MPESVVESPNVTTVVYCSMSLIEKQINGGANIGYSKYWKKCISQIYS
jgi:hypothetical protein